MDDIKSTSMRESILREIGSMGTAHAATALCRMTGADVSVLPTTVSRMPLEDVYRLFSSVPEMQVGIYCRMREGLSGCLVFFVPKGESYRLVDMLTGQNPGVSSVLGEKEQSVLRECGGTICASYINSIADMTQITIKLTVPKLIFDQRGQVLEAIFEGIFPPGTEVVVVENEFCTKENSVTGYFLMAPEPGELSKLIDLMEAHIR